MRKVILFEDKLTRDSLDKAYLDSLNLKSVLGKKKCDKILAHFMKDNVCLSEYETIIIHGSILDEEEIDKLLKKLLDANRDANMVIFTGEDTGIYFSGNTLKLSPKVLYSENLKIFLTANEPHILMLGYGKNWKVNIFLGVLKRLNRFIESMDSNCFDFDDFDDFKEEIKLLEIKIGRCSDCYDHLLEIVDGDDIAMKKIRTCIETCIEEFSQ